MRAKQVFSNWQYNCPQFIFVTTSGAVLFPQKQMLWWNDQIIPNSPFHVTNTPSQMLKTPSAPSKYRNTQTKTPSLPNINLCCFVQVNFRGQFTHFYDVKFTGLKTQWRTKVTNMSYATDKYTHNCNWKGS